MMKIIVVDDEQIALENVLSELNKALGDEQEKVKIQGFRDERQAIAYVEKESCDIAFLDIEMRHMSGLDLAESLKRINPRLNIIFVTGYDAFANDAFGLHASGYCMKPITAAKIKNELKNLRFPVEVPVRNVLKITAFGNFEVYANGEPLKFQYNRTKEMLAYLIDRKGALCSNQEIMGVLWEDSVDMTKHSSYIKNLRADLFATLICAGFEDVFIRRRGMTAIIPEKVECDYFDYLKGKEQAIKSYRGEYMTQYSWSEYTHGMLEMGGDSV